MASLGNIEILFSQVVCGGRQRQADLQRNSISKNGNKNASHKARKMVTMFYCLLPSSWLLFSVSCLEMGWAILQLLLSVQH